MSRAEQAKFHNEAVKNLHARHEKISSYLDQAYQDRVDGRISIELWECKAAEWEKERIEIARQIETHDHAAATYFYEGIKIIELAQLAYSLYVSQEPREQRRLLDVVVSNCRQAGSHHVYKTPWPADPRVNIQNDRGKAKVYQVRQVLRAIEKLEESRDASK